MKFEDFKKSFYSRVSDLSIFDAGEFNLLKTVLDGLKVDYAGRGAVRVIIFRPDIFIRMYFFLLRLKGARKVAGGLLRLLKHPARGKSTVLLIDPSGRVVQTPDGARSHYFTNLLRVFGDYFLVSEGTKSTPKESNGIIQDYNLHHAAVCGRLTADDLRVLNLLRSAYKRVAGAGIFSAKELDNIAVAFQQFFIRYRVWRKVIEHGNFKAAYLWPHYHREGCMLALREKGIKIVELQHGLIAPQDIFYALPKQAAAVADKALFADEIWVYGEFWKQQLLKGAGYRAEQIIVKGYFPFSAPVDERRIEQLKEKYSGRQIILFTTQTFCAEYFCSYIRFLAGELKDQPYHIIVKLHPAEKPEEYASLSGLNNAEILQENLEVLFRIASINISIYSTTLFDGLRFGVPGYAIWNERFSDYISFFRESGIIKVIQPDENPLKSEKAPEVQNVELYYAPFGIKTVS